MNFLTKPTSDAATTTLPATVERTTAVPAVIADDGPKAAERFFTFFTDNIRNKNTRTAYYRNACRFFAWCEARGLALPGVRSYHVSAYVEELGQSHEETTLRVDGLYPVGRLARVDPHEPDIPPRCLLV
jgi:hypothetical protein